MMMDRRQNFCHTSHILDLFSKCLCIKIKQKPPCIDDTFARENKKGILNDHELENNYVAERRAASPQIKIKQHLIPRIPLKIRTRKITSPFASDDPPEFRPITQLLGVSAV